MEQNPNIKWKDPWLAVCLSWLLPGIGQIYAKRTTLGIILLLVYLAALTAAIYLFLAPTVILRWGFIGLGIGVLFNIWNLFNAYKLAKVGNSNLPSEISGNYAKSKKSWLAVFLSYTLLPGLGQLYCRKWVKGIIFIIGILLLWYFESIYYWLYSITALYTGAVMYDAWNSAPRLLIQSKKAILTFTLIVILPHGLVYPAALLMRATLLDSYKVPSSSMAPTIMPGDRILAEKLSYKFSEPQHNDLVVFISPEDSKSVFVKRLVAKGGETVEIREDSVCVNGKLFKQYQLSPSRTGERTRDNRVESYSVPMGKYFVIGDNFANSKDSRHYGAIPKENIIGRVIKIYWPMDHTKKIE